MILELAGAAAPLSLTILLLVSGRSISVSLANAAAQPLFLIFFFLSFLRRLSKPNGINEPTSKQNHVVVASWPRRQK